MSEKWAVLVGGMAAPSKAFSMVKLRLEAEGWQAAAFLGGGKPIPAALDEMLAAVEKASMVLVGMSVPEAQAKEELAVAQKAVELGKPLGLYADTFGACKREHFSSLRDKANLVFVLNEEEKKTAEGLYPNAKVVVSGNHEWEDASFPRFSREEMRAKLGVSDDEKLLLLAGHKSVPITAFLLMSVVHAVNYPYLKETAKLKVIFAPHPGDGVSPKVYAEPVLYTDVPVIIVTKEKTYVRKEPAGPGREPELEERDGGFPSSDLLPAADILAESASTFCQAAAIQRIPVISVLTEVSKKRNVLVFGQREWEPVLQGVAREVVGDANELVDLLSDLLNMYSEKSQIMFARQEDLHPGFKEKGEFSKRIVQAMEEVVLEKK